MESKDRRADRELSEKERREGIVRLLAEAYALRLRRLGRLKPIPSKEDDILGSYNHYGFLR